MHHKSSLDTVLACGSWGGGGNITITPGEICFYCSCKFNIFFTETLSDLT